VNETGNPEVADADKVTGAPTVWQGNLFGFQIHKCQVESRSTPPHSRSRQPGGKGMRDETTLLDSGWSRWTFPWPVSFF